MAVKVNYGEQFYTNFEDRYDNPQESINVDVRALLVRKKTSPKVK